MRLALRLVAVALVIGIGLQVADAGWRKWRGGWGCAGPSCSAPAYVAMPVPVCSCCAPACAAPSCYQPGCAMGGCAIPGCAMPMTAFYSGYNSNVPYGGMYGMGSGPGFGYYAAMGPDNGYGPYGYAPQYPQVTYGGGFGYGVPSYYSPVPAQYAPIPSAPAADLVW